MSLSEILIVAVVSILLLPVAAGIALVWQSVLGGLLTMAHYEAVASETVTLTITVQKTDDLARKVQHLNVFNRWYGRMPKGKPTVQAGKLYSIGGVK